MSTKTLDWQIPMVVSREPKHQHWSYVLTVREGEGASARRSHGWSASHLVADGAKEALPQCLVRLYRSCFSEKLQRDGQAWQLRKC